MVGADWYCERFLRLRRRRNASEIRAMRATPPATPPPISAPRCLDDDGVEVAVGGTVVIIMFVVVMRPPLAADVTMVTMEMTLVTLDGD